MASNPSPRRRSNSKDPYANLKPGQKARENQTSFLTNRDGTLSVFRISLIIGLLGALLIGFGVLAFNLDQQSRRSPLVIQLPEGAQQWGAPEITAATRQFVYYRVAGGDVDAIAQFYDQRMAEHYGVAAGASDRERCQRIPPIGEYTNIPNEQRGNDGNTYDARFVPNESIPFFYRCLFDRSGLNATQWTQVTIYDGLNSAEPNKNAFGDVVIVYEQSWQP